MSQFNQSGLVLNDLVLNYRDTVFQIDSLFIANDSIYLYEVKNYTGSYFYKEDSFFIESGYQILNPLRQLDRSVTYLQNVLLRLGYRLPIHPIVVFINPEFTLYSILPNERFLFSYQLPKHLNALFNQTFSIKQEHLNLAHKLKEVHNENYRPDNLPIYQLGQLKNGILCPICFSLSHTDTRQNYLCTACEHQETITNAIERSIKEFKLLFPDNLMTTSQIYEWCGKNYSRKRIRMVLKLNYQSHLSRKMTYYSNK
ncbi:conserved hypothetical protein [Carnobacterium sp. 17-4]|nr:conserved hypothetical protein [Carnobacterium sp. 17-4]